MLSIPGDLDDFRNLMGLVISSSVIIASVGSFSVALNVFGKNSDELQLCLFNSLKWVSNSTAVTGISLGLESE